jgi:hypothetical protein
MRTAPAPRADWWLQCRRRRQVCRRRSWRGRCRR